ncbi:MAG: universal stress protein [Candidatus Lutibacillus vidarii]|nr:universal stress protein [Dermatophilaceae bacterium]HRB98757.1 universal stress protein [Dermatophilaceae bacterium]
MSVVVGYVSTKEGKAALRRAAEECALRSADLIVVHSTRGGRHADGDEILEIDAELDDVEARVKAAGLNVEIRHLVRGNEPAEDIIGLANEREVDLIVIGLRRRTPVGKLILGSNAQRILLDASCPVLAVKAEDDGD